MRTLGLKPSPARIRSELLEKAVPLVQKLLGQGGSDCFQVLSKTWIKAIARDVRE